MRGLWFVAGAGAGVYAMVRGRRAVEALSVDGLSDRWCGVSLGARMLRDEVALGQAEKEAQLRESYGLLPHEVPELGSGGSRRSGFETLASRPLFETGLAALLRTPPQPTRARS